jgi:MFS superfamily sulfate permease-like transporter
LYGAIAVGFFAALFGGTPSQISGPTGPMTVVMAAIVAEHAGNLGEAFAIVFLGGLVQLRGRFSYASARELVQRVGAETAGHDVIIYDFTNAAHIDTSAALAIDELLETARDETKGCFVAGLSGTAETTLRSLGVLEKIAPDHVVATRPEAIRLAGDLVDR